MSNKFKVLIIEDEINICNFVTSPTVTQVNYLIGNNRCNKKYFEEKDVCYVKIVQK